MDNDYNTGQDASVAPQGNVNAPGLKGAIARFQALPKNAQLAIFGVIGFFVLMLLVRSGPEETIPQPTGPTAAASATQIQAEQKRASQQGGEGQFVEPSRESLIQGFVSQQQTELAKMRDLIERSLAQKEDELTQLKDELDSRRNQVSQMMETFNEQMRAWEESNADYRREMAKIAEEARLAGVKASRQGGGQAPQYRSRKERISETPLITGSVQVGNDQALLQGAANAVTGGRVTTGTNNLGGAQVKMAEPKPFVPPLGFIKGTLLNGVDALAGSGRATPSLVRVTGSYKTAMNSTVNLDGCFMLVEFEGEISTERAVGKPSRMTCVYDDQGAVTYQVTGYVVDAEDGIIGVPGVFYEGDASRLAAAMLADFTAGVAQIIENNQNTFTVDSDGTATKTITGNQTKAELAGGVSTAIGDLRDYLFERANRVVPFVRLDATRDIHLVLLSGVELRTPEGSNPWTLLFDATAADAARSSAQSAAQNGQ